MKRVWLLAALGAASGSGCGDPATTGGTPLNLDRPIDVSFACFGAMRLTKGHPGAGVADDEVLDATAQPTAACAALSPALNADDKAPIKGQETLSDGRALKPAWYAFILQSSSGTVALATWNAQPAEAMVTGVSDAGGDVRVLDGDALTPGKNAISVGEDPIGIATDKAGCFEVTANAGSCDLSALEINSVLDDINAAAGKVTTPARVDRKPVTNALGGVMLARPAAMVGEPTSAPVGFACPATPTGRVYVAYPSCHLVAGIDTATGKIVSGIRYDAAGVPSILSGAALDGVTCPDECTNAAGGLANGPITPGVRPVALDLRFDSRVDSSKAAATSRLAIGAVDSVSPANGAAAPLTVVDLDPDTAAPTAVSQISLEDATAQAGMRAKLGVTSVSLSPQIGMGGNAGVTPVDDEHAPAGQGQYIYAVATDGTVRVADVLSLRRECDTQVDGRFLRDITDPTAVQCLAPRDPARPRRSGAKGPGIELPFGALPTSVAIFKGRTAPLKDSAGSVVLAAPTTLLGYFAMVMASSGLGYVVNIDDDYSDDVFSSSTDKLQNTTPVRVIAHQLRDGFFSRSASLQSTTDATKVCGSTDPLSSVGGALAGGPRLLGPPSVTAPASSINLASVLPLPTIQQVACTLDVKAESPDPTPVSELAFAAPPDVRDQAYPDLGSVFTETWSATWEGVLSRDSIGVSVDGPAIRVGQLVVDGFGMRLTDPSRPFCDIGAEPFDIVDLRGCSPANGDGDCPAGYTCYVHPKSVGVGVGACMLKSEAPRLADACFSFLTTFRRYTVGTTEDGQLRLLERKHVLETTPIDGCVDDATNQCDLLAQDAAKIDISADPFNARTHWSCQADPLRADPTRKRCIQVCSTDQARPLDCAVGTTCQLLTPGGTEGVCMEGVEPPQACINGPQRYDVRASEAFTVIGTRSGYVHPIIKDPASSSCIRDPNVKDANSVQTGRIPLKVPACNPAANPITGQLPGGGFEPNPCAPPAGVPQFDFSPASTATACAAVPTPRSTPASRTAQAIKFRNRAMAITLVDPYQSCMPGGQGVATNVPLLNRGYQIEFQQKAGYTPVVLPVGEVVYPIKVVRGPTESIWVVDDGDLISTSISQASTLGRVFRVEGIDISVFNVIQ